MAWREKTCCIDKNRALIKHGPGLRLTAPAKPWEQHSTDGKITKVFLYGKLVTDNRALGRRNLHFNVYRSDMRPMDMDFER